MIGELDTGEWQHRAVLAVVALAHIGAHKDNLKVLATSMRCLKRAIPLTQLRLEALALITTELI